jgi:hypothetical protein
MNNVHTVNSVNSSTVNSSIVPHNRNVVNSSVHNSAVHNSAVNAVNGSVGRRKVSIAPSVSSHHHQLHRTAKNSFTLKSAASTQSRKRPGTLGGGAPLQLRQSQPLTTPSTVADTKSLLEAKQRKYLSFFQSTVFYFTSDIEDHRMVATLKSKFKVVRLYIVPFLCLYCLFYAI